MSAARARRAAQRFGLGAQRSELSQVAGDAREWLMSQVQAPAP